MMKLQVMSLPKTYDTHNDKMALQPRLGEITSTTLVSQLCCDDKHNCYTDYVQQQYDYVLNEALHFCTRW